VDGFPSFHTCRFEANTAFNDAGAVRLTNGGSLWDCEFINNEAYHAFGALHAYIGDSLRITDCVFEGNSAGDEVGAVGITETHDVLIIGSTFDSNTSMGGRGGAVAGFSYPRAMRIEECEFIGNSAHDCGGAVYSYHDLAISNCLFDQNTAGVDGGGIAAYDDLIVSNCHFLGNAAAEDGGAIQCSQFDTIADCLFLDNEAVSEGGGMKISDAASGTMERCTFARNTSGSGGSAIRCRSSIVAIARTTFYGHHSEGSADGTIHLYGNSEVVLSWCIVAGGTGSGPAVYCQSSYPPTVFCSDIYGNEGGDWTGCIADQYGLGGNISLDPWLCSPEEDNFYLHEDSPCVAYSEPNPECDQIGAWPIGCMPMDAPEPHAEVSTVFTFDCSPNPFSSSVRLVYSIPDGPKDVQTQLSIFDITGRHVETLVNGLRSPGTHEIVWTALGRTGSALPAGVYFHVLQAGDRSQTMRVLLMR